MKLCRFAPAPGEPVRLGIVAGEQVRDLSSWLGPDGTLAGMHYPDIAFLQALRARPYEGLPSLPLAQVQLLAPVLPPSFRDFYAFEAHVRNARRKRGLPVPPEWYEAPVFYFSNPAGIFGPDVRVPRPPETRELDYELELAVVIGREGSNIPSAEADDYVAGFTLLNDWSARDVQRREMRVGLGPAKGKDFATTIGPWLTTPDELDPYVLPDRSRGRRYALAMEARVNGECYSVGNSREMHWTFAELIAVASRNTTLRVGDLIGSGTVGTGCITEFPEGVHPWLEVGDEVTLQIEALGSLTNRVSG